jgi:tRNA splicing ligase
MVVWSFLFENVRIQKDSSNLKKFNFKNCSNLKIVQIQKLFGFVICSNPKNNNQSLESLYLKIVQVP